MDTGSRITDMYLVVDYTLGYKTNEREKINYCSCGHYFTWEAGQIRMLSAHGVTDISSSYFLTLDFLRASYTYME